MNFEEMLPNLQADAMEYGLMFLKALDAAAISIPFPQRDVHIIEKK